MYERVSDSPSQPSESECDDRHANSKERGFLDELQISGIGPIKGIEGLYIYIFWLGVYACVLSSREEAVLFYLFFSSSFFFFFLSCKKQLRF